MKKAYFCTKMISFFNNKKLFQIKLINFLNKLNKYYSFLRNYKALKDHALPKAEVIIFVSSTHFVKNSEEKYDSEIVEKLIGFLTKQNYSLNKISLIGMPPFFLKEQELGIKVNRINYTYLGFIIRQVLINRISFTQANSNFFTYLINKSQTKIYYATNYYPFLDKLKTSALHSEYLHGYAYKTLPFYFKDDVNHLYEIICLDKYSLEAIRTDPRTNKTKAVNIENSVKIDFKPLMKPEFLNKYRKVCLYTISGGYHKIDTDSDHEILDNGICPESFLLWIQERKDIAFIFRPHPTHYLVKYKGLMKTLFQLEKKNSNLYANYFFDWNLKQLLNISDIHFTMSSNSVYFNSKQGILTYSLCHNIAKGGDLENYMADLEKDGFLIKENYKTINYNVCVE